MESPRIKLEQIWELFGKEGVLDDLLIIEHIAALLLPKHSRKPPNKLLQPRRPDNPTLNATVRQLLSEAAVEAGSAAELFDRYTIFYLSKRLAGARFPTPRHIVDCLLNIIQISREHDIGDFACGSGGYLVHAAKSTPSFSGTITGVEMSLEWARLAWANVALHDIKNFRIELGNSFQVFGPGGALRGSTYDRILMSPPFGEPVDEKLVSRALKQKRKIGRRSETAFVALALECLAADGRAAVLVSSTFLFTKGGEAALRKELADQRYLEAVIALPQSALEPYSDTRAYVLIINKARSATNVDEIWFFRAERDGYPEGRSRELTEAPSSGSMNDLSFVENVVVSSAPYSILKLQNSEPLVFVKSIRSAADVVLGLVVKAEATTELLRVEYFSLPTNEGEGEKFVIVEIKDSTGKVHSVRVNINTGASDVINKHSLLRVLYSWKVGNSSPGVLLLDNEYQGRSVGISFDGKLVGMGIPHDAITQNYYDLRPELYVPEPITSRDRDQAAEPVAHQSAATLLSSIRSDQQRFLQAIETLMGQLEARPASELLLPSPLLSRLRLLTTLSKEQNRIWKRLRSTMVKVDEEGYLAAQPFTQDQIMSNKRESDSILVQSTIDLLESLGVLVPITIPHPDTDTPTALYRLATERDEWMFEREAVMLKGDGP
jgi:type I restriction enzyme M protein